jgi:hypothetical protein
MLSTERKPVSVGEMLVEEFLTPLALTQGALAEAMGVPGQKATVVSMPAPGTAGTSCASSAAQTAPITLGERVKIPHEVPVVEDLGVDTIQGIEARGLRSTSTIPAAVVGNDEPMVRTAETWSAVAPGLAGVLVRSLLDDPQSGKNTKELVGFRQEEPEPSVFQPPAGYEVVNRETESCFAPVGPRTEPATPMPPPVQ